MAKQGGGCEIMTGENQRDDEPLTMTTVGGCHSDGFSEIVLSSRVGVAKFGKNSNGTREDKGECRVEGRP